MPRRRVAPAQRVRQGELAPELQVQRKIARVGSKRAAEQGYVRSTLIPIDDELRKKLSTHANRVAYFRALMASDKWVTGVTVLQVADRTGYNPNTLQRAADQASRELVDGYISDPDTPAKWRGRQERAFNKAMELGQMTAVARLQETDAKVLHLFEENKTVVNLLDVTEVLLED